MVEIDIEKVQDPGLGTALGLILSFALVILVFVFRAILTGIIIPRRRPSSKLDEAYFSVITLAIFFFFFYLISPAFFYFFTSNHLSSENIPNNFKLAQFFMTLFIFCVVNTLLQLLDLGYRTYCSKKNKLLNNPN